MSARLATAAPTRGVPGRPDVLWPAWFGLASALIGVAAALGVDRVTLAAVGVIVTVAACRDVWQVALTVLLASLTLATAPGLEIEQPFLLRFIIASGMVVLTLILHRGRRLGPAVRRHVLVLGVFFAAATIGALLSDFSRLAFESVAGTAVILGIPVVATFGRWQRRGALIADLGAIHRFLWVVVVLGVGLAIDAGFGTRSAGIHANPNTFAFMGLLAFGLDLGLRARLPWWSLAATVPVTMTAVLSTGSRGALLGCLLAPAYLLLRQRGRRRSARVAASMLLGLAVLLVAPVPTTFDLGRVVDRTFGGDDVDLSGRQDRWEDMLFLFRTEPIVGHGLRSTAAALGAAREVGDVDSSGGHSSYLQVLAETGLLGALPLFGSILLALLLPAPPTRDGVTAWVAASGVVVAGLGHMIGESFVLGVGSPFPLVFWSAVTVLTMVGGGSPQPPDPRSGSTAGRPASSARNRPSPSRRA